MGFWGTLGKVGLGIGGAAASFIPGVGPLASKLISAGAGVGSSILNQQGGNKTAYNGNTSSTSTNNINQTQGYQFDPAAMTAFNTLVPQGAGVLGDYMNDPYKSTFFNQQLAGSNRQLAGLAERQKANYGLNMSLLGGAPDPGRQAEIASRIGRSTSAMQSNAFLKLLMGAEEARRGAATAALNYKPLQTGSTLTGTNTTNTTGTNMGGTQTSSGNPWGTILGAASDALGSLPGSQGPHWGAPTVLPAPNLPPGFGVPQRASGFIDPRLYGGTASPYANY